MYTRKSDYILQQLCTMHVLYADINVCLLKRDDNAAEKKKTFSGAISYRIIG